MQICQDDGLCASRSARGAGCCERGWRGSGSWPSVLRPGSNRYLHTSVIISSALVICFDMFAFSLLTYLFVYFNFVSSYLILLLLFVTDEISSSLVATI